MQASSSHLASLIGCTIGRGIKHFQSSKSNNYLAINMHAIYKVNNHFRSIYHILLFVTVLDFYKFILRSKKFWFFSPKPSSISFYAENAGLILYHQRSRILCKILILFPSLCTLNTLQASAARDLELCIRTCFVNLNPILWSKEILQQNIVCNQLNHLVLKCNSFPCVDFKVSVDKTNIYGFLFFT